MEVYIKNNPEWTDYESMINVENQHEIHKQIVEEVEKALEGYHEGDERKFYYQADGDELQQVFCDDESGNDTISWSIGLVTEESGKLKVLLHC